MLAALLFVLVTVGGCWRCLFLQSSRWCACCSWCYSGRGQGAVIWHSARVPLGVLVRVSLLRVRLLLICVLLLAGFATQLRCRVLIRQLFAQALRLVAGGACLAMQSCWSCWSCSGNCLGARQGVLPAKQTPAATVTAPNPATSRNRHRTLSTPNRTTA